MTYLSYYYIVKTLGGDTMLTLLTALINLAIAAMTLYGKLIQSPKKKASKRSQRLKTRK